AALTGAVAGRVVLLMWNLLDSLEGFQVLRRFFIYECASAHNCCPFRLSETRRNALSPQPNPLRQGLRLTFSGLEHDIGHGFHVRHSDFAATEATNETNHRRSGAAVAVHGRANFRRHHATQVRRTEREVAINDADGFEALQALGNLWTRKRPEPAQANEAAFLAFFAQLTDCNLDRRRERSHAEQHNLRIFGNIFYEERIAILASERFLEVGIDFANHATGDLGDFVVLPSNLRDPIFIGLWSHRNYVVGME